MSALFPHDAVVQRYLHTGKRRSGHKIVIAAVLGVTACGVVFAALPANSSKRDAEKLVPVEPAQSPPAPVASAAASAPAIAPTATTAVQENAKVPVSSPAVLAEKKPAMAAFAKVETGLQPPAYPPPVPTLQASAAPAPQPVAPLAAAPAPAAEPVKSVSADDAPTVTPPKPTPKVARKDHRHREARAIKRSRLAHQRNPRAAQPTLVRVYTLPDGRQVYRRVTAGEPAFGYPGGELRRVYLAPAPENNDFD
jgi:hypothetical protein